jgi:large repetitive protein
VGNVNQSLATTVFSEPVTFTVTLSQPPPGGFTPTGTVTLSDGGNLLATVPLMDIGGGQAQATFTTSTLSVGSHTINVVYSGDGNFNGSSIAVTQKVVAADSTTNVSTTSPNPNTFGQPTTFVATVTPKSPATATPTGNVTFLVDGGAGTTIALMNGQTTFTMPVLAGGSHTITATYSGDGNFNPSNGSFVETINLAATTTTLAASPNPSVAGQAVTFTATVSGSGGTPTGVVTFFADGNSIGTGTLGSTGKPP